MRLSPLLIALLLPCFAANPAFTGEPAKKDPPAWKRLFDGKSLAGWMPTNFGGEGEVLIEKGAIVLETGTDMTGITYAGKDFPRLDYEVEIEAKKIMGNDFFCTTTFPVGKDYCSLVVGGWGGPVVGLSSLDNRDASENETKTLQDFERDKWYKVRIRVSAERISAWIDDKKVVDQDIRGKKISTRPECDPCRPFGIATWRTVGAVREVRVRLLGGEKGGEPKKESAVENWPSWRGPRGTGESGEKGLPTEWGEDKNVAWKHPMPGRGGSTPIIWEDRIFLTSGAGENQVLLCLSTKGKKLWERVVGAGGRAAIKGDEANEASASPATDGKHVWAFVGSGHVACFDLEGNPKWKVDVQDRYGKFKIQHGLHTTPVVYGDHLYLSLQHSGGHWVVALNKATGDEVWKAARKTDAESESMEAYSSPCIWETGKGAQLVVLGADYATGHRLTDGVEIWRLADLNPKKKYSYAFRIIASPVAAPEVLVVPTARGLSVVGLKPAAEGLIKAGSDHEYWRKGIGSPDVPSPLIHNGLVYLCRENGVLQCWDAKTGEERYQGRLHATRYRASPTYADGKIYVAARDGTFSVVKAGPKFELLATNQLPDAFTASPAISNGVIYLRGFENLYAIRGK